MEVNSGFFECGVCLTTMMQPSCLPCTHTFCDGCIRRTVEQWKKCPTCDQPGTSIDIKPNYGVRQLMAAAANKALDQAQEVLASPPQAVKELASVHRAVSVRNAPSIQSLSALNTQETCDWLEQYGIDGATRFRLDAQDVDGRVLVWMFSEGRLLDFLTNDPMKIDQDEAKRICDIVWAHKERQQAAQNDPPKKLEEMDEVELMNWLSTRGCIVSEELQVAFLEQQLSGMRLANEYRVSGPDFSRYLQKVVGISQADAGKVQEALKSYFPAAQVAPAKLEDMDCPQVVAFLENSAAFRAIPFEDGLKGIFLLKEISGQILHDQFCLSKLEMYLVKQGIVPGYAALVQMAVQDFLSKRKATSLPPEGQRSASQQLEAMTVEETVQWLEREKYKEETQVLFRENKLTGRVLLQKFGLNKLEDFLRSVGLPAGRAFMIEQALNRYLQQK